LFSTTGNFTITNSISPTNGADLTIVAGGNILSAAGANLNTSASGITNSGNILLVAGANYSVDSNNNLTINQSSTTGGGSATGGSINLTGSQAGGSPILGIDTSSILATGGAVTMVAYAGSTVGSGSVQLPANLTISSNGGPLGAAGDVTVIAGGTTGTSISLGNISANNAAQPSNIIITAAKPNLQNVVVSSTGSQTSGTISADALNLQTANISVGNINAQGTGSGNVVINTGGSVAFKTIDTSGAGGGQSSYSSGNGLAGHDAQSIAITAGKGITGGSLLAYGGGGGGGAGSDNNNSDVGRDGGAGGPGGNIILSTTTGNIALSGVLDNSGGGGGGGGGGGSNAAGGNGGAGGVEAHLSLIATAGTVNVAQGIFSVEGARGGSGGTTPSFFISAIGGGGGGSYGGGGGAGGTSSATEQVSASGGGGGYYGGGGAAASQGVTTASNLGGSGGGAGQGGSGATGSLSNAGSFMAGGRGQGDPIGDAPGSGGAIGVGGGMGTNETGFAPTPSGNVISGDTAQTFFAMTLTGGLGIGTALAPLSVLGGSENLSAGSGSIYIQAPVQTSFSVSTIASTGTLSLQTSGNLLLNGNAANAIDAANIILTTTPANSSPQNVSGSISIDTDLSGSKAITLTAGGFGLINSSNLLATPTLTTNTDAGNVSITNHNNSFAILQFKVGGSLASFQDVSNLNVLTSNANGAVDVISTGGKLTVSGPISGGDSVVLTGLTGVALNSTVGANDLFLTANSGTITSPFTITANAAINLTSTQSGLGTLSINTPSLVITAPSATITDLFTGDTNLSALGSSSPHGNLTFTSAGSQLQLSANSITNFGTVTLKNTAGSISLSNNAVLANTAISLTAQGNITGPGGVIVLSAPTVSLNTVAGNITAPDGLPFGVSAQNISITGSTALSSVNIVALATTPVNLNGVTANTFNLSTSAQDINVVGKVSAADIELTSGGNIMQTALAGLLSGTTIELTAAGSVASTLSPAGLTVALSGTGNLIELNAANAAIQSAGIINIGGGTIGTNLNVKSTLGIVQSGALQVGSQGTFNSATFTQTASGNLSGGNYAITAISAVATAATFNGVVDANAISVVTPARGAITVAADGVIDATSVSMQIKQQFFCKFGETSLVA
jgi:hypothetical protein